jgi:hypothetical protein
MKAIGLPPSDPRISQMNDAQWLWCYFNLEQDETEEAEERKALADYLSWFINPEMAQRVHEETQMEKQNEQRYQKEHLHKNSAFDLEMQAINLGYDPSSGISAEEFLAQKRAESNQNRDVDIANDSFDDLLASGMFEEVQEREDPKGAGNPHETFEDFMDRVMFLGDHIDDVSKQDAPIGIGPEDVEEMRENARRDLNNENQESSEPENEYEIDDDDLDIFDIDD